MWGVVLAFFCGRGEGRRLREKDQGRGGDECVGGGGRGGGGRRVHGQRDRGRVVPVSSLLERWRVSAI